MWLVSLRPSASVLVSTLFALAHGSAADSDTHNDMKSKLLHHELSPAARAFKREDGTRSSALETWHSQAASAFDARCRRVWHAKVNKTLALAFQRDSEFTRHVKKWDYHANTSLAFDAFEPVYSCESRERLPFAPGDGPKWACGLDALQDVDADECLVFSFGSNGDPSFEYAVHARLPHCRVFTFDPSMGDPNNKAQAAKLARVRRAEADGALRFVDEGLSGVSGPWTVPWGKPGVVWKMDTLEGFYTRLSGHGDHSSEGTARGAHRVGRQASAPRVDISLLKVDIEGSEYEALAMLSDLCAAGRLTIGQLQIEVHQPEVSSILWQMHTLFVQTLERSCGLALFNKEVNTWSPVPCSEFSFIGPEHAWRAFRRDHPSCEA